MQKSTADLLASGNIDALLALHRATFGDARMEDTGGAGGQGGTGGDGAGSGGSGAGGATGDDKKFSQADMNATVARAETAAKAKAEADLAAALGCSVEEAKQVIADRKAADDAKKSEAERAAEAAKTAQADAERIKAEASTERHHARLERALSKAGVDVENAAMLRAAMASVEVTVGADADAIKAAVEKAKTDAPALFGAAAGGAGGGTHSDSGGQGNGKKAVAAGDFGKDGATEAARRFPEKEKQTA